jgi:uncharacterized protein (TIRG00374 family)
MKISAKKIIYTIFSITITISVFWYLLSKVALRDVITLLKEANLNYVFLFVYFSLITTLFRTWRYQMLLQSSGYNPEPFPIFLIVLVRNLFADLVPARAGSLIYIYLVNARLGIPLVSTASSFFIPFIFDIIAIVPMIVLAIFTTGFITRLSTIKLATCALFTGVLCGIFLKSLPWMLSLAQRRIIHLFDFTGSKYITTIDNFLQKLLEEIIKIKSAGIYIKVFVLSVMIRTGKYASLYFFLLALLFPLGYSPSEVNIARAFLGFCAAEFAAGLPISGIAGFGTYEGVWTLVFSLLGFPARISASTGIAHHLFTQVYGYSLGAIALILLLFVKTTPQETPSALTKTISISRFYTRLLTVILISIAIIPALHLRLPSLSNLKPDVPSEKELAQRTEIARLFPGRIIFDSNRSGTFGIYTMKPDGTDIKVLNDSPAHEMYPDVSPDGQYIVFARARTLSRLSISDIILCWKDGSHEQLLVQNGTFPTFSSDGNTVYFERERKKIMAVKLNDRHEYELFPCDNQEFINYQIVKPRISPDEQYAVFISDKKGRWNCWIANLKTRESFLVGPGCEGTWFNDSRRIAWISTRNVKERTGIYMFDITTKTISLLHDDDAPRGHEYFPTIVNDRFLLWSACQPDEHSHTSANYQIFIKDLNSGLYSRLTFDIWNNRWAKWLPQ